jgi:hypothetical protein
MGFFVASVALVRAGVEAALRTHVAKYLGRPVARELELKDLIDRAPALDKPTRDLAHKVRILGNDALHKGLPVSDEQSYNAIEVARMLVANLAKFEQGAVG